VANPIYYIDKIKELLGQITAIRGLLLLVKIQNFITKI